MPVNYLSIQEAVIDEIEIKKSRFITYLYPIQSEEEFDTHLAAIRKEHYKATHHCQAFILNEDASIQRMSDDGEPSGTAGVPMLEVLKNNDLTYIMAVTVRYFGGTKLGAGGLIRAYSSAVSEALEKATIVKNVTQLIVECVIDYSQNDLFTYLMEETSLPMTIMDTQYTDKVTYQLAIDKDKASQIHSQVVDRFNGQVEWTTKDEQTVNLPLKK